MRQRRTPRSVAAGAVVGTFVVGDGTLVGQGPAPPLNKPQLILNGKAFAIAVYTDFHQLAMGKPSLICQGKQVTIAADSSPVMGRPKLLLNAKALITVVPIQTYPGKAQLLLNGKTYALGISAIETLGKPSLILTGKHYTAGEVALLPTLPIGIGLVPTVPQDDDALAPTFGEGDFNLVPSAPETATLVPSAAQSYDLIPTAEEFR